MKVLLVVHQYLPRHVTGTEQYVRTVARELIRAGVEAHVFAFEPLLDRAEPGTVVMVGDEVLEDVPVHRHSLHDDLRPNYALRDYASPLANELFARVLDEHRFDVVHAFHLMHLGIGAIEVARDRGIPVVVHLMDFWFLCPNYLLWHRSGRLCDGPPDHGAGCVECLDPDLARELAIDGTGPALQRIGDLPTPAGVQTGSRERAVHALLYRKERMLGALARADRVIAPSRFLQSVFVREGLDPARIQHVPYGLDPARFADMPPRKAAPGRPHLDLGYIGSISRHKGVQVLLDAVAKVDDDRLRVHLYGRRHSQPGYSEGLLDGIADSRVTFHGPFPPGELGAVLAGLDALVVPSLWYENTPFSVLEALHVHVPVLASDRGGISEIVRDRENGRLFPAGDAGALAAVLREWLGDPDAGLRVRSGASVGIQENVARFLALYRELGAG